MDLWRVGCVTIQCFFVQGIVVGPFPRKRKLLPSVSVDGVD
jgi:hypothetical protein